MHIPIVYRDINTAGFFFHWDCCFTLNKYLKKKKTSFTKNLLDPPTHDFTKFWGHTHTVITWVVMVPYLLVYFKCQSRIKYHCKPTKGQCEGQKRNNSWSAVEHLKTTSDLTQRCKQRWQKLWRSRFYFCYKSLNFIFY